MADTILHKRNLTSGVAPTTESLSVGELAINVADRKLYTRSGSAIVVLNDNTGSFTGSFTGEFIGTASFATSASYAPVTLPGGIFSSSLQVDYNNIQNKPTTIETASYVEFSNVANKPVLISSSNQFTNIIAPFTGSFTGSFKGVVTQSNFDGYALTTHRYLELYPTDTAIAGDPDSAYFYISGSTNDLWYTHKTDSTVNFDWIEGVLETGLLHGGISGFSGTGAHIRSGSGIIVNHNATVGNAPSPTVTYIQWPAQTASIDVSNGFVTYLAVNSAGIITSQSTKFTSQDYNDKLPLGAVGHFNQVAIAAKGEQVNTQYSAFAQLTDFTRHFGPIKVGGYGITPQSSSLKFSRASGDAFIYGGFYSQNPETPSNYQTPSVNTGSLAYIYRTGSVQGYSIDANNNNFYTSIIPGIYDTGNGTGSLASNEWSIQRVFIEPVTGIHYIYAGQNKYTSLANALSNLTTDSFSEGPATTLFTVFIGYIIAKGNTTNLLDTTENSIVNAGLFRNTSAGSVGGGAAAQLLNDLSDVTLTSPSNGQALVYSSGVWVNGVPTDATSASYATSGSYVVTASFANSASYAPTILPGGIFSSSLQVDYTQIQNTPTTIETASYVEYVNVVNKPELVSSSGQISYTGITNVPVGILSSSTQINGLTGVSASFATTSSAATSITFTPSTASFSTTSSFATTSSAATSITFIPSSASFATTASAATSITFVPSSASFATTASAATSITFTPSTASFATTASAATSITFTPSSASFSTTSSFATTASFAPYGGLRTKAGAVTNTSFTGNPKKATVTFTTAFPNTSYAVTVTGEDSRAWSIESKLAGSFVINANSNTALAGTTYWVATAYGET